MICSDFRVSGCHLKSCYHWKGPTGKDQCVVGFALSASQKKKKVSTRLAN